jgi:hypothetical protein
MTGDHAEAEEAEEVEVTSTIAREDTEVRMRSRSVDGRFMLLTNLQTMILKIADLSAAAMKNLSQ